ncbi:MAG TPA: hypothetical protein VGD37_16765 [Kofleriaceae bacterium]
MTCSNTSRCAPSASSLSRSAGVRIAADMASSDSDTIRFPIRFERWYGWLSSALLLRPSGAYVEIRNGDVECRMGWAFRTRFPRSTVVHTAPFDTKTLSRGVHGFAGRWLVNGSGDRILAVDLEPPQRATVFGIPVRLRQLLVSVDDPDALAASLENRA